MENVIIIAILFLALVVGIGSAIKHFKGESGCCGGGGSYKPKKKKLKKIIATKVFKVGGMNCEHCQSRVTEVINDIPGVSAVVDLKKAQVTVSYEMEVADDVIRAKVERAGYTLDEQIG